MKLVSTILFSIIIFAASAQSPFGKSPWELGIYAGPTLLSGDIGGFGVDQYNPKIMRQHGGMHARYKFSPRFSVNTSFQFGLYEANDAYSSSDDLKERNLMVRTTVAELASVAEYHLIKDSEMAGESGRFNLFVFGGVSIMGFNPRGRLIRNGEGVMYNLHPLQLEGDDYSRVTIGVPMGLGMKYNINDKWSASYTMRMNYTFSDYIDDASDVWTTREFIAENSVGGLGVSFYDRYNGSPGKVRGNPESNDWIMSHQLGFVYRLEMGEIRRSNLYHFFDFWFSKPGRKKF